MRISNRAGRLLGCILIVAFLPLTSLFTQEQKLDLRSYLEKATEEIPEQNKSQILAQTNPPTNDEVKAILHNITEEVPDHPKPVFVNSRSLNEGKYKIQLGYFKEKKNVHKMVKKVRKIHNWPVFVKTENNNGTDYFRVLIVDISNKKAANEIMQQLNAKGLKAVLK